MPRAFDDLNTPGKGLPHSLANLRDALSGGIVGDSVAVSSGAVAVELDVSVYESAIDSGATAGNEVVEIPVGAFVGQRHLVTFGTEGDASDVVRINAEASQSLQSGGIVGDTPAAVTNIDLDTPGEFALLEYQGGDVWNLLYTDGVTS